MLDECPHPKNTQAKSPVIKLNTNKNPHQAFVTEVLCTPSAEMTQQHPQEAYLCARFGKVFETHSGFQPVLRRKPKYLMKALQSLG